MQAAEYLSRLREGPYMRSEMAFPLSEYKDRVARLREAMRQAGMDGVIICDPGSMYYFTGYYTFETSVHAAVIIPLDGEIAIQVPPAEVSNVLIKGWIDDVIPYTMYQSTGFDESFRYQVRDQLVDLIHSRGMDNGKIGIDTEQAGLRIEYLWQLQEALPKTLFVSLRSMLLEIRGVKSPKEIEYHREAARITSAGMRAGLAYVREGRTENDVAAEIYSTLVREGSEFNTIQPIVVSGYRSSFNHMHFFRRKIQKDEHVLMEIGGVYNRYCSPLLRFGFAGTPSQLFLRVHGAVNEALSILHENARTGASCHDVVVKARKPLEPLVDIGFWGGFFGYGVGCQFPPSWVERSGRFGLDNHQELKPGMVFHTPIGMRVPNQLSASVSETIVIRESGSAEILTDCPRELICN